MKKFFKQIIAFIKAESKQVRNIMNDIAEKVVIIGQDLKEAIENPNFDILVSLTKTEVDDKILKALRAALTELFPDVKKSKGKEIQAAIKLISSSSKPVQQALISKAGALTLKNYLKTKKIELSQSECDTLIQLAYKSFSINQEENKPVETETAEIQ